jgi:hypothetical protein
LVFHAPEGVLVLVEAKSLPVAGEEHQLRTGLGQLVEYRAELAPHAPDGIRCLFAVPRTPRRLDAWRRALESVGMELIVVGPRSRGLKARLIGNRI